MVGEPESVFRAGEGQLAAGSIVPEAARSGHAATSRVEHESGAPDIALVGPVERLSLRQRPGCPVNGIILQQAGPVDISDRGTIQASQIPGGGHEVRPGAFTPQKYIPVSTIEEVGLVSTGHGHRLLSHDQFVRRIGNSSFHHRRDDRREIGTVTVGTKSHRQAQGRCDVFFEPFGGLQACGASQYFPGQKSHGDGVVGEGFIGLPLGCLGGQNLGRWRPVLDVRRRQRDGGIDEPGPVGEKLPDSNPVFAVGCKFRPVLGHGKIEVKVVSLGCHDEADSCDALAHGKDDAARCGCPYRVRSGASCEQVHHFCPVNDNCAGRADVAMTLKVLSEGVRNRAEPRGNVPADVEHELPFMERVEKAWKLNGFSEY
ncbi:hypothetical protein ARTHRO9V_160157 [Arthrobacter sp. 9V]|nr:hypothetical protein ARTHRO9V_160157 [Arthrobacter sp. 9V]